MSEIIDKLSVLGLNAYETRAYAVLLKVHNLSASEISKLGDIPNGRIYNILQGLIQKGFCLIELGPVRKYRAIRPEVAISQLLEDEKARLAYRQQNLAEIAECLEEVFAKREGMTSPLEFIQVLTSRSSQIDRFNELVKSTKRFLRAFCKPPYVIPHGVENLGKVTKPVDDTLAKGVRVRGLWEIEKDDIDNFIAWVSHFESRGEEVRVVDYLPIKSLIVDEYVVMFTLQNSVDKNESTSMVVQHCDLTQALITLHDMLWEKAMTLTEFLHNPPS